MNPGKAIRALVLGGFLVPVAGGMPAVASTADGVLITALASMTYMITAGTGQTVSYSATVNVFVMTPVIMVRKTSAATVMSQGGIVTFCISYSNSGGMASAFGVVITDVMPDNMRFVAGAGNFINETGDGWSVTTPAWSTDGGANWTSGSYPGMGQGAPLKLRWTVDVVSRKQSGFICYTVSVI